MKIKTYYASTDCLYDNVDAYLECLPLSLKRHVLQKKNRDAKVCSLGGALLLDIAASESGADVSKVVYAENGKPYIPDSDFYFSISHTKGYASVSFGNAPSGCDIQITKDVNLKIAERFYSDEELSLVRNSNDKTDEFFKIWCRKESAYKLSGQIYCTEKNVEGLSFADYVIKDNLQMCVCTKEGTIFSPETIDFNTVF